MKTWKRRMLSRILIISLCSLILMEMQAPPAQAADNQPRALILYSVSDVEQMPEVVILDMLVGQFTDDIVITDIKSFDSTTLDRYTHVIFFNEAEKTFSADFVRAMDKYTGNFLIFGDNVRTLGTRFSFLKATGDSVPITDLNFLFPPITETITGSQYISRVTINPGSSAQILATAVTEKNQEIPLIIRDDKSFICLSKTFFEPFGNIVSEALNAFFDSNQSETVCFLRIEDIHPNTDPVLLRETAEYLASKNIPYMIAVIPTYINNDVELHFSDAPRLVKTLQYMQENGASIILHGYRHQYRDVETGEGFEFWDVQNDRPIYQSRDDKVLHKDDFSTETDYLAFLEAGVAFEREYIISALTNGVQELVAHKLYPLAFEAPHYTMSGNGYKVVSEFFDAYVGRLQISDTTWEMMGVCPYASRPNYLHGMILYPETLGFVEEGKEKETLANINDGIKTNRQYSRKYLSVFYHPYLGHEYLQQIVEAFEQIEGAKWLDLKQENLTVTVGDIQISAKDGQITVKKPFISGEYEMWVLVKTCLKWMAAFIWGVPFAAGIIYIIFRKIRKNRKIPD